jgi:hypothetical protein
MRRALPAYISVTTLPVLFFEKRTSNVSRISPAFENLFTPRLKKTAVLCRDRIGRGYAVKDDFV